MESEFKKYLRNFLKRYHICDDSVDFDRVNKCEPLLEQLGTQNLREAIDIPTALGLIFDLHQKGIYLYRTDYQSVEVYATQKDQWVEDKKMGIFSVENYIERFLLEKQDLLDIYESKSIYAMGNPYELADEDCKLPDVLTAKLSIPEIETDTDDFTDKIQTGNFDFV